MTSKESISCRKWLSTCSWNWGKGVSCLNNLEQIGHIFSISDRITSPDWKVSLFGTSVNLSTPLPGRSEVDEDLSM